MECFSGAKEENRHLFFIGNEGSAAITSYMKADFMKNCCYQQPGKFTKYCKCFEVAVVAEMKIITLIGFRADNKVRFISQINVYVPVSHFGMVEFIHNIVLQEIVDMI